MQHHTPQRLEHTMNALHTAKQITCAVHLATVRFIAHQITRRPPNMPGSLRPVSTTMIELEKGGHKPKKGLQRSPMLALAYS